MANELQKSDETQLEHVQVTRRESHDVMALLKDAVLNNTPVEQLERIIDLHERISQRAAAEEFAASMTLFQQNCPPIPQTRSAKVTTKNGSKYGYTYAKLQDIMDVVVPVLTKYGLSIGWDSESDGTHVTQICHLRHANRHSVSSRSTMPIESAAGMSACQKVNSARTYARTASLVDVLGIVTSDLDLPDDPPTPVLTPEQHNEIGTLIQQSCADSKRFLAWLKVDSIAEISQTDFARAKAMLERKLKGTQDNDTSDT